MTTWTEKPGTARVLREAADEGEVIWKAKKGVWKGTFEIFDGETLKDAPRLKRAPCVNFCYNVPMILGKDGIERLPPPVGTSDWATFSRRAYCVDKTFMIKDLIDSETTVALFTRQERGRDLQVVNLALEGTVCIKKTPGLRRFAS